MVDRGLLPFLAGVGRLQILDPLRSHREADHTINGLAREVKVPLGTTWRAVHEMADLGLLFLDRVGSVTLVRLNPASPAWTRIGPLLEIDLPSPHRQAHEYFSRRIREELPGVTSHLFGSVRSGTHRPSSDVDVVYGKTRHPRARVQKICDRLALETLGRYRVPVTAIVSRRAKMVGAE